MVASVSREQICLHTHSHTVLFCSWYDNSFRGDGATGPCGSHLLSVHRLCVHVNTHQAQRNGNHNTRKRRGRKVTPANDEGVELGSASARLSSNLSAFAFMRCIKCEPRLHFMLMLTRQQFGSIFKRNPHWCTHRCDWDLKTVKRLFLQDV